MRDLLNSFPPIDNTPPHPQQLEISIFGPGVGESIVIHLGYAQWMIIDSCVHRSDNQPAAIKYLESIGVDLSTAVKLVLVSHWHDDHIKGLANIVKKCESARICYSAALLRQEFLSLVSTFSGRSSLVDRYTAGTREMADIIRLLEKRVQENNHYTTTAMVPVLADKILFDQDIRNIKCTVRTLSPADKSFHKALDAFASMIPDEGDERITLPSQKIQNHNAIVVWISFNDVSLLLGSDLEETGDLQSGWSAVLNSPVRPSGKANIFKIPHHGSPNGHYEKVWDDMIIKNDSVCLLTSFTKGRTPRPQSGDIKRIKQYTSQLFLTSPIRNKPPRRAPAVERTLRGMAVKRNALMSHMGHIQVRAFKNDDISVRLKLPAQKI